jgi:hypothetical protein
VTTDPGAAQRATALEAMLDGTSGDRGELLVEAAEHWRLAGNDERAITLLDEAIAMGGADGGHARVVLVDVLFGQDRVTAAEEQLDMLRRGRPAPGPCHMAAELMEERGDLQEALRWFNIAVSRLSDQQMAERGFLSFADNIIGGRRRIRGALGLPPDSLDESMQAHDRQAEDFIRELTPPKSPAETQVLFWPRAEIPRARETWPGLIERDDVDAVVADREAANRKLAATGVKKIVMVPQIVARLLERADPMGDETRRAYAAELVAEGRTISWPPERNSPCWCGSAVKYKRCCGRPNMSLV